ncbi:MAG: response regulator [Candidatus Cloacimonadales bacterium]
MKILIIDDNKVLNCLLAKYLCRQGHKVENVFTGKEGLEKMLSTKFDVLITDYRLPDINGLEILELMKQQTAIKIMISAYANHNISEKANLLGAQVLEKPFHNEKILGMIG